MSSRPSSAAARLTRRQWTALMATGPLLAQAPVTAPPESAAKVTTATTPVAPETQIAKAATDVRSVSDKLSMIQIPMAVEPSFVFKV